MAVTTLTSALNEFELALDDLSSNFEFVRKAARLRPRLKDMLHWEKMDGEAKTLAKGFLRQRATQESLLYRGLVVSLAGAFEQFVRRILRDTISHVNNSQLSYDTLSDSLRRQNPYRTGMALQTVLEPVEYLRLDYESLSKNIGTCFKGSPQSTLNADAFPIFVSVASPEKFAEALERIGMKLNWDSLGSDSGLRSSLGTENTRETAKTLQEFLKRFGQTRNKIAHTGSSGIIVTEAELEQMLATFRAFGRALTSLTSNQLLRLLNA